ncbi:MAG: hypothetical protein SF187_21605 [Deltaproteobacteria bacterium]|nr:hypothetical protein [Deltaproteobacteria bacterium]
MAKRRRAKQPSPPSASAELFEASLAVDDRSPFAWLEHDFFARGLATPDGTQSQGNELDDFLFAPRPPRKWWRLWR